MIAAIETEFKGYRFRSRLEARWAVFFDAMEIEWRYEAQGFEKIIDTEDGPGETVRYLPDFYLPEFGTWVEVKGILVAEEAKKMASILDWGSPLTWFSDSALSATTHSYHDRVKAGIVPTRFCPGLLVLGEIPEPFFGLHLHKLVRHHNGLISYRAMFVPGGMTVLTKEWINAFVLCTGIEVPGRDYCDALDSDNKDLIKLFDPKAISAKTQRAWDKVVSAYKAARQARFEHGETGVRV